MSDPEWKPDGEDWEDESAQPETKRRRTSPKKTTAAAPSNGAGEGAGGDAAPVHDISLMKPDQIQGIANPPLKIASFNIQVFGERKMNNEKVTDVLMKILQRYDLILILEIRDSSETALNELVADCNRKSPDNPFATVVSARLGRTHSKEQYAFMYRVRKLKVTNTFQFDDGVDDGRDMFQREPFAARFYSPTTELEDFAIIATHTDPDEADKEIGNLHLVYEAAKRHWNMEDIMIAGDFNADEGYVNREDWEKIVLKQDKKYTWLIKDSTDTTTGNTDRAYDRFVVAGAALTRNVVPGRTGVFKFDQVYGLDYEEAKDVSDHYPIEMALCGKVNDALQAQLSTSMGVTVTQKTPVSSESDARRIYRADTGPESAHFTAHVKYDDSRMLEVVATRHAVVDVESVLKEFQTAFPDVLEDGTIEMVLAFLAGKAMLVSPSDPSQPYIYGLAHNTAPAVEGEDPPGDVSVTVTVRLQDPLICSVNVAMKMT